MKRELLYDKNNHNLYYDKDSDVNMEKPFILTVGMLQLVFNYTTSELVEINGFVFLQNASLMDINVPPSKNGVFKVKLNSIEYVKDVAYDFIDIMPRSKQYLMRDLYNPIVSYDCLNKTIMIGNECSPEDDITYISVNENLVCGIDENNILNIIYIRIDRLL